MFEIFDVFGKSGDQNALANQGKQILYAFLLSFDANIFFNNLTFFIFKFDPFLIFVLNLLPFIFIHFRSNLLNIYQVLLTNFFLNIFFETFLESTTESHYFIFFNSVVFVQF